MEVIRFLDSLNRIQATGIGFAAALFYTFLLIVGLWRRGVLAELRRER